jgi:hypothetical protein
MQGSCLCGDVVWEVEGAGELVHHCHCGMCRKAHGTPYATFGGFPEASFRIVRGKEGVRHFESSRGNQRSFCGRCGSVVPGEAAAQGLVFVPFGGFEDDPGGRPLAHIFVASKASWHDIDDDLPRFDAYPEGYSDPELIEREVPRAHTGKIGGSCLCTAVAYEFSRPADRWHECFCSRCRRARQAAHGSNLFVPLDRFAWTRGEENVESYKVPEAARFGQSFCRICGAKVPRVNPQLGFAAVPAGSLDDDPGMRPQSSIFVESKAAWAEVPQGRPAFAELP